MLNIIDQLSPEAKTVLDDYSTCNVGVFAKTELDLPTHVRERHFFTISVYPSGTTFPEVSDGSSLKKYQESQPISLRDYFVLIRGESDDSGTLLGILKKYGTDGFLYKPFDQTRYRDTTTIKYDYSDRIVKLIEPYSFLKGGGNYL